MARLFVDVDALCKLAHWNLLSELPNLLGTALSETSTLTSARFRALKSLNKPDGKAFRNVEAAQVALNALSEMAQPLSPDPAASVGFAEVPGIDPGEAVLFATLASVPGARLLTGDKRALRAFSELPPKVRAAVAGRVVIVEQVIELALQHYGLEWLQARVCPWKQIDTSVSMIMGSRCDQPERAVRENLVSAIGEMRSLCDPSLLFLTDCSNSGA